jgi:nucleoside-diphosphate-sugar epimerase
MMKVFLTGATGFVGNAVLKGLVSAGHTVKGLAQDTVKAEAVRAAGGIPVLGDLLVPTPWSESVKDCDVVISASSPFHITEQLSLHEAERRAEAHEEMVGNLIHAATNAHVQALVLTYHVTAFGNQGDQWASEVRTIDPVGLSRPTAGKYWDIERAARKAGMPIIEVFPGWVYGPGSWFKHYIVEGLKAGTARIVGAGNNYKSLIHIDDLVEGFRLILARMPLGERFCLVDGNPVTQNEFFKVVATEMGLTTPEHIDYTRFSDTMGEVLAEALSSSVRVSNAKAMNELGFKPMFENIRQGVPDVLKEMGIRVSEKAA